MYGLARYGGLGQDDQTMASLTFPAWVPKLTEPTKAVEGQTYVSVNDYNLLIKRANERNMTNTAVGAGVGFLIGWAMIQLWGRRRR